MTSALVLGEDTRSFLSVIRSLGEAGITVDVVCYDNTAPALNSKWIRHASFINYQAYTSKAWIDEVVRLINERQYDLVFPCDERAIYPLSSHRALINSHTQLAIPNQQVRDNLFDKSLTKQVAITCGVNVAKGELLSLQHATYDELSQQFTHKFVVKPTESFNEDSLSSRNKVAIINSNEEFEHYVHHNDIENKTFLVEEYFEGTGEGVSVFACKGKVQYLFAHTRVNEPRAGGGSSYRKAIPVEPSMAKACIAICDATDYDGVGMFEFKRNLNTNQWILVEVNARFWGSLPLAIHAGVNFPKYYADYLLGRGAVHSEPKQSYNLSAYARSFTSDIYDIRAEMQYLNAHQGALKGLVNTLVRLGSFYRVLFNEKIDSFDKQDPAPFKHEVKQLLNSTLVDKVKQHFAVKNANNDMQRLLRTLYALEGRGRLVFVCYGNIMRSPLAEAFSAIFMTNTTLDFDIESYGFHQNEGRNSPVECIQSAAKLGIDLAPHKSKQLLQRHLSERDIVFIFDQKNQLMFDQYYRVDNLFCLADFIPQGLGVHREISDPYGQGDTAVDYCYLLIIEALKNIYEQYLSLK